MKCRVLPGQSVLVRHEGKTYWPGEVVDLGHLSEKVLQERFVKMGVVEPLFEPEPIDSEPDDDDEWGEDNLPEDSEQ